MSASLAQLQREMQQFLLHPDECTAPPIRTTTRTTTRIAMQVRLDIYAEAYRARLLEALATDYVECKKYLGDEVFDALGQAYIEHYPSQHFSLRWFGKWMPDFLAATAPYNEHVELTELARFEWAQGLVFDAADIEPIAIAELAAVAPAAWAELRFELQPASQLLSLTSNAPLLWSALNDDATPPPVQLHEPAVTWLVWRQDLRILFRELAVNETTVLRLFAQRDSFPEVCAQLCELLPEAEVPGYAAGLLRHWINAGLIAKICG